MLSRFVFVLALGLLSAHAQTAYIVQVCTDAACSTCSTTAPLTAMSLSSCTYPNTGFDCTTNDATKCGTISPALNPRNSAGWFDAGGGQFTVATWFQITGSQSQGCNSMVVNVSLPAPLLSTCTPANSGPIQSFPTWFKLVAPSPSLSPSASPSATPTWTACPVSPATFPVALFPAGAVAGTLAAAAALPSSTWQPAALAGAAAAPGFLFAAGAAGNSIVAIATSNIGAGTISGAVTVVAGGAGPLADGVGTFATFSSPAGITSAAGALYVADFGNNLVRAIALPSGGPGAGTVTTFAGKVIGSAGVAGYANGVGPNAQFRGPTGIATDGTNLYVADSGNNIVRAISLANAGVSTLLGGSGLGNNNIGVALAGYMDGVGSNALFRMSQSITGGALPRAAAALAVDTYTNTLYILDANNVIRSVRTNVSFAATSTIVGTYPNPPGNVAPYRGTFPGSAGTASVQLNVNGNAEAFGSTPGTTGLAVVRPGVLAVSDGYNLVRIVDAVSGNVTLLAGGGSACGTTAGSTDGTGVPATSAFFTNPGGVYYEGSSGTLFVADSGNNAIRAIYPPSVSPSVSGSVTPSTSVSPSVSPSTTTSTSLTVSASVSSSTSASASASSSTSPSVSASNSGSSSPSLTGSVTWSTSASSSTTPSTSVSASASVSGSTTASATLSGSVTWSSSVSASVTPSTSVSASTSASASASASVTLSGSVTWSTTASTSVSPSVSASRSVSWSLTASPSVSPSTSITPSRTITTSASASISISPTPTPVTGYVQVAMTLFAPTAVAALRPARALQQSFSPADYTATNLFYAVLALKCDLATIGGVSAARVTVTAASPAAAGLSAPALAMAQRNATLAGPELCAQLAALAPAVNASAPAAAGTVALAALTYQLAPSFLDGIAGNVTGDTSYTLNLVAARVAAAGSNSAAYPLTTAVWDAINGVGSWPVSFLAAAAPTIWGYAYGAVPQSGALTASQSDGLAWGIGVSLALMLILAFFCACWSMQSRRAAAETQLRVAAAGAAAGAKAAQSS